MESVRWQVLNYLISEYLILTSVEDSKLPDFDDTVSLSISGEL
jgi:hypothetical protein